MPLHLYRRVLQGTPQGAQPGDWLRSDLAVGRKFGPAKKSSRISADGEDGDPVLFRPRLRSVAPARRPVERLGEVEIKWPTHHRARWPEDAEQRLRAAALATGAEYVCALDNGLLEFACQPGTGRRFPGGATYWSVNAALRGRTPDYPLLSTTTGRGLVLHNPGGRGMVVADDVFVWTPESGKPPSEWRVFSSAYRDLDYRPKGLPVVFYAVDIGPWGGVAVLVRLVEELCALGVNAQLVHSVKHRHRFQMPYSPWKIENNALGEVLPYREGVLLATNWWTASFLAPLWASRPGLVPGAFWQDIESRFRNEEGKSTLTATAVEQYVRVPNRVVNAGWVVEQNEFGLGAEDFSVIPIGVDCRSYCPEPKLEDPIRIVAMWRPCTPVSYTHLTLPTILRV